MAQYVKPDMAHVVEISREGFAERLRLAVDRAGGKRVIAKKANVPERSLGHYLAGTAEPTAVVIGRIAVACGFSANWLLMAVGARDVSYGEDDLLLGPSFKLIPRLEVRASAGAGALVPREDDPSSFMAFRSEWLSKIGVRAAKARTMLATGDSMEPTIRDGDLLLVDESIDRVVDHSIYVVVYQGMVLLKRVQLRTDGTLVLKSDNARYDDEVINKTEAADILIAGRVRWFGRTI